MKNCKECGKLSGDSSFCSAGCANVYPKCLRCGKPYEFSDTQGNEWCSHTCRDMAKLDGFFSKIR